MKPNKHSNVFD